MSANISRHLTPHPVLMQETTKECLKTKIHQKSLGMGFNGRLAHLRGDAMRSCVNPLNWKPVNPLIELSLPKEETMEGVSCWLQKLPQMLLFTVAAHFDPVEAVADPGVLEAHGDGSYSEPALSGVLPFILPFPTGEGTSPHGSLLIPQIVKSAISRRDCQKSSSLVTRQGASASISWLYCLVSSLHLIRTCVLPVFTQRKKQNNPSIIYPVNGSMIYMEKRTVKIIK